MAFLTTKSSRRGFWLRVATLLAFAAATAVDVNPLIAAGFRVATQVFFGDDDTPAFETTTLFHDGAVYDFISKPQQTAVFRKPGGGKPGRFILLNDKHQLQTEVSTEKVAGAMTKLRKWASKQDDKFLKFAADPKFTESFEQDTGKLILASHLETYTVDTTKSAHADALDQYREFVDWYAQLNSLLAGGPPPEPRLKVNEALARQKVFPISVELARQGEEPLRAKHNFTWRLSREDFERIDGVGTSLAAYQQVSNVEFLRYTRPAAVEK